MGAFNQRFVGETPLASFFDAVLWQLAIKFSFLASNRRRAWAVELI
jgi:hypothetical protein